MQIYEHRHCSLFLRTSKKSSYIMKQFIVVIAIAAVVAVQALTDEQKAKVKQYHDECSAATGVNQEIIDNARKGDFVDDEKFKEHLLCFSKKAGFQNDAGEIQADVLKAKLGESLNDPEKAAALVDKCAVQKDTPQNTAYETIKCYYQESQHSIA